MMDLFRKLMDVSLQSCRLFQSQKTGFVHDTPETICLYTNFLFALALLRQKTQESVQEAKFVLDRLLSFQQADGNFPVYMHDFPVCRDFNNAAKIVVPLYWIRKEFAHVLGEALAKRLSVCFDAAQKFAESHPRRVAKAFDEMTPENIAEAIIAEEMKGEYHSEFCTFLSDTWHMPSKKYCGAAHTQQVGFQPEITLYDYCLGYFTDNPNEAILKPQFAAIAVALLAPTKLPLTVVEQHPWSIQLRKNSEPMTILAGEHTAMLSLPGGVVEEASDSMLVMQLSEEIVGDNIEKADVLSFFVDALADVTIFVNGQKSTTFHVADTLDIQMGKTHLTLQFQIEGAPEYIGHIMKGNRPRQRLLDRAYDWQILLRKVRGEGRSRMTLGFKITHE